jgi:ubiquinone/menaquinone biosynthesis C-methylase UbiE
MTYERITSDPEFDNSRQSHEYRYQIIGKLTEPTDKIVDMACGTGYGRMFLKGKYKRNTK